MKLLLVGLAFVAVAAASKYLPPQQDSLAVLEEIEKVEPSGVLAQDGYRYKTIKRYRHRRDVNPLTPGYLAPVEEVSIQNPNNQYLAPIESVEPIEQLGEDGYRYKTVKRLRHRNRRDISELSSYLPPVEQKSGYSYVPPASVDETIAPAPIAAAAPIEVASPIALEAPVETTAPLQDSTVLANDGYRYKTVRRIRYRQRRDISELPSSEYLPPVEIAVATPINQYIPPVEISEPIEGISEDGYRYKTVKRLRHRNRRDVSEVESSEYLPPVVANAGYSYPAPTPVEVTPLAPVTAPAPVEIPTPIESVVPASIEPNTELASDGYRYKTVRRIRYRVRRDVGELASTKYLPPNQEKSGYSYPAPAAIVAANPTPVEITDSAEVNTPVKVAAPVEVATPVQESAVLANDGYRYKTVRRIRYRVRRDVNEIPSNDYLPPATSASVQSGYSYPTPTAGVVAAPTKIETPLDVTAPGITETTAPIEQSAELANDGYRYKTVRRIRYRIRRDISELPAEYLPPVQELVNPEPNNEYLAPIEAVEPVEQLADDGYRYKTVKRLRYRNRRDVNEIPAVDYLPPVAQKVESSYAYLAPAAVAVSAPAPEEISAPVPVPDDVATPALIEAAAPEIQPTVELGSDGYRYRTVKRIRYRQRRDVSDLVGSEYLPPRQETALVGPSNEYLAPVIAVAEPIEQISADGYRYKTIKKYKTKRH